MCTRCYVARHLTSSLAVKIVVLTMVTMMNERCIDEYMDEWKKINLIKTTYNTIVGHQNWDRYVGLDLTRYPTHSQLPVTMDLN